ncbi:unnamed protein product [Trichobilharzia regenti]|nr:unnamed protein product [Trichobilharzia regenti]
MRHDSVRPEDASRRFILSYWLADDMISIFETPVRNSGFIGGTFLKKARVAKPGSTIDNPVYYGPADFSLGSKIDVFGTRFIITDADEYVVKFLEANRDQFPDELITCLRARLTEKEIQEKAKQQMKSKMSKGCNLEFRRELTYTYVLLTNLISSTRHNMKSMIASSDRLYLPRYVNMNVDFKSKVI